MDQRKCSTICRQSGRVRFFLLCMHYPLKVLEAWPVCSSRVKQIGWKEQRHYRIPNRHDGGKTAVYTFQGSLNFLYKFELKVYLLQPFSARVHMSNDSWGKPTIPFLNPNTRVPYLLTPLREVSQLGFSFARPLECFSPDRKIPV